MSELSHMPTGLRPVSRRAICLPVSVLALAALACAVSLLFTPAAFAAAPTPAWAITATSQPTNFAPGATAGFSYPQYAIVASNVGGAPASGPITISDTLPSGLTPAKATWQDSEGNTFSCSISGQDVTCTDNVNKAPVEPSQYVRVSITLSVAADASGSVTDQATISGGGAPTATATTTTTISASPPSFGFVPGAAGLSSSITEADGSPSTQAGTHPYALTVGMDFPTQLQSGGGILAGAGTVRDVKVNLPQGVVVNPNATSVRCTEAELETDQNGLGCPDASQIGTIAILTQVVGVTEVVDPIYNMVPPPGVPAEFGFDALGVGIYVHLMGGVRTGSDYALSATSDNITAHPNHPVFGIEATFWDSPSDPSFDYVRTGSDCRPSANPINLTPCPVQAMATPLLTMPSACSASLPMSASADSWESPGDFDTESTPTTDLAGNPVGVTGCDNLDFTPSIAVQPDTSVADSPSGLAVDLKVPQTEGFNSLAEANLKDTTVVLPQGVSVSPSAANGLVGCSEAQIGLDNANEPSCPDASKIGTVQVTTPLLPDVMTGGVYVAQQGNGGAAQGSNPFGSLLAIYVTAEADGALIKLAGQVVADPVTGQLTATFDNNPELPFSDFKLDFFGGPGGVLTTPQQCGTYTSTASLSPWSGTPAVDVSAGSFQIDSGCVTGFSPSFAAGSVNAQAGAYTPFTLNFSRQDTDQFFSGLSVKLPEGVVAKLAGVGLCSDAQLAAAAAAAGTAEQANPSCPASSQVGTVEAASGPGSQPFYLPGKVYLTGPYKGAPYGLAVVVPAVAGPYDLGTVVVRQQLQINPDTAQVTVVSDKFPTILQGIPLQIRSISVNMNRPDFTINPTSCDVMSVGSVFSSTLSITADESSRFQVGGCAALKFSPKLKMKLTGKGRTKSGDHPNLIATYTVPSGDANTSRVRAALPLSLALDPNNSQVVCPYATAQAVTTGPANCPPDTQVGTATAYTPLLSQPLSGPVYLVQGLSFKNGVETHTLPTLLVTLRGQIALNLRAQTSVSGGKLVSTFSGIPDAAVSKFVLQISGGKKGILVITGRGRSICGKKQVTDATLTGQNGKAVYPNIKMSTPCRAPRHKTKRHRKYK